MRIVSLLLLTSCASETTSNPLADEVNAATGYQVLACLPLNYAAPNDTFSATVDAGILEVHQVEFRLIGFDGAPLHCALLPGMPPRLNYDKVTHFTITFDHPLAHNNSQVTLIYYPPTVELANSGNKIVMDDYRRGVTPVLTHLTSEDGKVYAFNLAPAAMSDDVTIAVLPIPEGGRLNPVR